MKNKKVLLIAHFSVQNFKVSVESWKSYIVVAYAPCVDSHCWSVDNVNSWICGLRRICLIFFAKVETHFFLKCTIRKFGPFWADWNCHVNFFVANVGPRNISEKRHEHPIIAIGIIHTGPIFSAFIISFFKLQKINIFV